MWHWLRHLLGSGEEPAVSPATPGGAGGSATATERHAPGATDAVVEQLIVGLGNPGKKYAGTRHNVGFLVVDRLAGRGSAQWQPSLKWKAEVARTGEVLLCKPLTFMNESGRAVRALADFYKLAPSQCIIIYDDVALPFGSLRIRRSGSAGGHNGMKSIIACLGTQDFPRVRIGVGEPGGKQLASHVLGSFSGAELQELPLHIEHAADAVDAVRIRGVDAAMAEWNGKARAQG